MTSGTVIVYQIILEGYARLTEPIYLPSFLLHFETNGS